MNKIQHAQQAKVDASITALAARRSKSGIVGFSNLREGGTNSRDVDSTFPLRKFFGIGPKKPSHIGVFARHELGCPGNKAWRAFVRIVPVLVVARPVKEYADL